MSHACRLGRDTDVDGGGQADFRAAQATRPTARIGSTLMKRVYLLVMTQSRTAETDVGVRELHDQLSRYVRPRVQRGRARAGRLLANDTA